MNEFSAIQVVSLMAWLVLAGSAYASFKLNWRQAAQQALIWAAIFASVAVVFTAVGPV